jgi:hypothetical protein
MLLREGGDFLPGKAGVFNSRKRTTRLGIGYFPWERRVTQLDEARQRGLFKQSEAMRRSVLRG